MSSILIYSNESHQLHKGSKHHHEKPERVTDTIKCLKEHFGEQFFGRLQEYNELVALELILKVHSEDYVHYLQSFDARYKYCRSCETKNDSVLCCKGVGVSVECAKKRRCGVAIPIGSPEENVRRSSGISPAPGLTYESAYARPAAVPQCSTPGFRSTTIANRFGDEQYTNRRSASMRCYG